MTLRGPEGTPLRYRMQFHSICMFCVIFTISIKITEKGIDEGWYTVLILKNTVIISEYIDKLVYLLYFRIENI